MSRYIMRDDGIPTTSYVNVNSPGIGHRANGEMADPGIRTNILEKYLGTEIVRISGVELSQ